MRAETILKYNARVPRYTSYPTAAQFHTGIDANVVEGWLSTLPAGEPLSLYLHVPYCRELCWYCGCNMRVVRRDGTMTAYTERLAREFGLIADRLPARMPVRHIHWGGGTPSVLGPARLQELMDVLHDRFDVAADAEVAIEIDPRVLDDATAAALGDSGFNRASIGIQDLNTDVQRAVNRLQSWEQTRGACTRLREVGIANINLDLIYGLPHQTRERLLATIDTVLGLQPDRIALFGYAHVPWMKPHQRLIDEAALPGPRERLEHQQAASDLLVAAGYQAIGLDHFAAPDTAFARAARDGRLRRNFQGYTDDGCRTLIGFGVSAISDLPQGMAQNAADVRAWQTAIDGGRPASVRGVARSADDARRADVIERLMCDFAVDLAAVDARHPACADGWARERAALADFVADGLVDCAGDTVRITPDGRPIVRAICAVFDRYLDPAREAHAIAV